MSELNRWANTREMTEATDAQEGRVWPLWISILSHQLVFTAVAGLEVMLVHVSAWVSRGPIFILWGMYLVAPFTYLRPSTKRELLRRYAIAGWLFVLGAIAWGASYWILSEKYGVPVSWDQVRDRYMRGAP